MANEALLSSKLAGGNRRPRGYEAVARAAQAGGVQPVHRVHWLHAAARRVPCGVGAESQESARLHQAMATQKQEAARDAFRTSKSMLLPPSSIAGLGGGGNNEAGGFEIPRQFRRETL